MIPIAKPLMGEEEREAIVAVLESGMLAQGPKVEEFERAFAAMCGVRHAVATSSGTTALHLALLAHGIGPGDEVITSPFTFISSANSVLFVGAKPVFVDIDESSYNIDPSLIEAEITSCTKALMPVHLFGNPCDMEAVMAIAARHGLIVIEDAAQAHGASINGKKVGSFGTGCFSFYPTKNMTTAEGGMVTSDNDQVAEEIRLLRNHGMKRRYYHDFLGYNFRMTDLQAALGLTQLAKLEVFNEKRIANARYLTEHLRDVVVTPQFKDGCRHVFHQYTIRVKGDRDKVVEQLKKQGVGTGIYYPLPVHKQPVYQELGYTDCLPVAEAMSQEVISLPVHPALSQADLERIVAVVSQLQGEQGLEMEISAGRED
jgi:perosamine synthetase